LGECDFIIGDGGERAADFSGVPEFWGEDSAERFAQLAEVVCHWGMAGRSAAMAPDVHVDLHRDRGDLSRVSAF
jgi:RNA-splicing ligase RtcB